MAVYFFGISKTIVQSFVHLLKGSLVKMVLRYSGCCCYVKSGSTKVHVHKQASEISLLSKEHDVSIDVEWVPGSENEVSDFLIKMGDVWQLVC